MAEQAAHETGPERKGKYGTFETGDGETVVYDRNEPTAWLQSNTTVEIRE